MFQFYAPETVIALVEAMLPRGTPDRALYVPLELRLGNLGSGTQVMHVALLFHRPRSYTLVAARSDRLRVSREQHEEFILKSYHDSAWRHDGVYGVIREVYTMLSKQLSADKKPLAATACIPSTGGLGTYEVKEVDFDSTDYTKPVIVHWRGGHD